jgi:hypothetical protein
MLSVILSACLLANPTYCRDFKIPLDVEMDLRRCTMAAAPYYARWIAEHPQWEVKRWKCVPGNINDT